jgi:hypothetical protein
MKDEPFKRCLLSSKKRRARMWGVRVLRMGWKSETHPTYARLQLDQIGDTPAFVTKARRKFLISGII